MSLKSTLRALLTIRKGVFTGLNEDKVGTEPFRLFDDWYREAREAGLYLPESMTLATCTPDGLPSARLVLLKRHDERGFVFFDAATRTAIFYNLNSIVTLMRLCTGIVDTNIGCITANYQRIMG